MIVGWEITGSRRTRVVKRWGWMRESMVLVAVRKELKVTEQDV